MIGRDCVEMEHSRREARFDVLERFPFVWESLWDYFCSYTFNVVSYDITWKPSFHWKGLFHMIFRSFSWNIETWNTSEGLPFCLNNFKLKAPFIWFPTEQAKTKNKNKNTNKLRNPGDYKTNGKRTWLALVHFCDRSRAVPIFGARCTGTWQKNLLFAFFVFLSRERAFCHANKLSDHPRVTCTVEWLTSSDWR